MFNVVIFGKPGSGKGTQANFLKDKYDLYHISTGDLFRKNILNETDLGIEAKSFLDNGDLVPDIVTIKMLENEVTENKGVKGFNFDGFPRTLNQAESLDIFLESVNQKINATIALEVDEDELITRLLDRGKTTNRSDDQDIQKIKNRFNEYNNKTSVLINFYQKQSKFYSVNGHGTVEDITLRLFNLVDSLIYSLMIVDNFVDYVKLTLNSGKGGKGSTHLRREKFVPKGGPDGGDGGNGGNIIIKGNSNLWTLQSFRYKKHFKAGNGGDGSGSRKSGSNGEDIIINVPLGTVVKELETENIICEINDESSDLILLKGGKGGRGNSHFKSPTNQTPRYSQSGLPGKELKIILELKVLADVGLVGYPNAGKSTLLSVLSDAKPKIADYEFTTLKPNLGIVAMSDYRSFVMADIPGIIEGASEGRGLGHYFLRHIERNSILLYVIPVDTKNIKMDFVILQKELIKYNSQLADKDFIIAFSKADLMDQELLEEFKGILEKEFKDIQYNIISSVSTFGINELKEELWNKLNQKN